MLSVMKDPIPLTELAMGTSDEKAALVDGSMAAAVARSTCRGGPPLCGVISCYEMRSRGSGSGCGELKGPHAQTPLPLLCRGRGRGR